MTISVKKIKLYMKIVENKIFKLILNEQKGNKKFGSLYKKIKQRIYFLMAVDNLEDYPTAPPYSRHKLGGDLKDCYGISVSGNWRIIIRSVSHEVDLSKIREIEILDVCDYH